MSWLLAVSGVLRIGMWFADLFQHRRIKKEGEQSNAYKALLVRKDRVDKALGARRAAKTPMDTDPHNRA